MPTVPVYDVPQVSPDAPPDVRSYATEKAFGAGVGTAIQGLGKEVDKFGDVMAKHALLMQGLKNQAEADEAQVQFTITAGEMTREQNAMEGKKRAESYQTYIERLEAKRREIGDRITNPEARRAYESNTRRQFSYSVAQEAGNAGRALKTYNSQSNQNLVTTSLGAVQADPTSDAVFEESARTIRRAVDQEGLNRTSTPEEVAFQQREQESALWGARIAALADKDPEAAAQMYEANKDKINAKDAQVVKVGINTGRHRAGSQASFAAESMRKEIDADVVSIRQHGYDATKSNLTYSKVSAVLGKGLADEWQRQREVAERVWYSTNDVATLTPQQMHKRLQNLQPSPGGADYLQKQQILTEVQKSYTEQLAQRNSDPAQSVDTDPTVKEINRFWDKDDPNGRSLLIDARLAAQTRAGIPKELQSPITATEAEELTLPLKRMMPGQERETLTKMAEEFKKQYGNNWEQAFTYALKTQRLSAQDAVRAVTTIKRMQRGEPDPSPEKDDEDTELKAARDTASKISKPTTFDPLTDPLPGTDEWGGVARPIFGTGGPEKKKKSLSDRILDKE